MARLTPTGASQIWQLFCSLAGPSWMPAQLSATCIQQQRKKERMKQGKWLRGQLVRDRGRECLALEEQAKSRFLSPPGILAGVYSCSIGRLNFELQCSAASHFTFACLDSCSVGVSLREEREWSRLLIYRRRRAAAQGSRKNVCLQHEASGSKHVPFLPLPNRVHLESCVQPSQ